MIKNIAALAVATALTVTPIPQHKDKPEWENGGKWRITTYCETCNDPAGTQSTSGKTLEYGYVAMNGVPLGTKISIDGEVFEVVDRCGVDRTVDIFIPNDGFCQCNTLEYKKIQIQQ